MIDIKKNEDKGTLLTLLTDSVLILIAIFGSLYYTYLIGVIVFVGWFFLEYRRMRIRRIARPLVVYPSVKFSWIALLAILGIISLVLADMGYGFFFLVVLAVMAFWWFVSFRVYRYYKGRSVLNKMAKPEKVVAKRKSVKKVKKKATKKKTSKKKKK